MDAEIIDTLKNMQHRLDKIESAMTAQTIKHLRPMTIDEAADYLSISKSYLYALTSRRIIPHYKNGKRVSFLKKDLDDYQLTNKIDTLKDIDAKADSILLRRAR